MAYAFHFAPRSGWMNDPNGLVEWQGRHHLFFQHNPEAPTFGTMAWGHASSVDLLRWEEHPVALRPSPERFGYDRDGCYSGCAVAVGEQVHFLYTGVEGDMQLPCLATAADAALSSLVRDPSNPVIRSRPASARPVTDFRDHALRREDGEWRQVVGGGRADVGGTLFSYRSADLRRWHFDGLFLDARGSGIPGTVWECPDVWRAGADGVVLVSAVDSAADGPDHVWWAVGELGRSSLAPRRAGRLDLGDRLYAPQSYRDGGGRRIMVGWLRTHLDPGSQGAQSVGVMSVPRELALDGDRVVQEPIRQLQTLRRRQAGVPLLDDAPATEVPFGAAALELVLDGPAAASVDAVELVGADGAQLTVALGVFDPGRSAGRAVRLLYDHGIVEAFCDGKAGSWSCLRLAALQRAVVRHPGGGRGSLRVWELAG